MRFAYNERSIMRKSSGEPKSIEAEIESSNSEEQEQTEGSDVPQADEPPQDAAANVEGEHSDDWWSASQQAADWSEPATGDPPEDVIPSKEPRTADVYFCGHTTFFPTLAREEGMTREVAVEHMQQYGQKLFSQLWVAPRVWIMFEKNADLLTNASEVPGEPNIRDWALETLRLVENVDQTAPFEPASIPAYTKDGFERVQKLKLTPDEAQFASQFNGTRSVQQIAKNLRLDLKSARQMLFRFVALEIVECWPASTASKPQQQNFFQRLGRSIRRDR